MSEQLMGMFDLRVGYMDFREGDRFPMIQIESEGISYATIPAMYGEKSGEGIQIDEGIDESAANTMCRKVAEAVHEYLKSNPKAIIRKEVK